MRAARKLKLQQMEHLKMDYKNGTITRKEYVNGKATKIFLLCFIFLTEKIDILHVTVSLHEMNCVVHVVFLITYVLLRKPVKYAEIYPLMTASWIFLYFHCPLKLVWNALSACVCVCVCVCARLTGKGETREIDQSDLVRDRSIRERMCE